MKIVRRPEWSILIREFRSQHRKNTAFFVGMGGTLASVLAGNFIFHNPEAGGKIGLAVMLTGAIAVMHLKLSISKDGGEETIVFKSAAVDGLTNRDGWNWSVHSQKASNRKFNFFLNMEDPYQTLSSFRK